MRLGQDLLSVRLEPHAEPEVVASLLEALPAWFGIPASNAEYVDAARRLPGFTAWSDGGAVGIALWEPHFDATVELHLIAVAPDHHRSGVGRALVAVVEDAARERGARLLEVKTLGPSHPDANYAATRRFYAALGFLPVEELSTVWDEGNPCLIMVKPLPS